MMTMRQLPGSLPRILSVATSSENLLVSEMFTVTNRSRLSRSVASSPDSEVSASRLCTYGVSTR